MLGRLQEELRDPSRGLQLRDAAGKWRLDTKSELENLIAGERVKRGEKPLTEQALEALAVIALKQPVTIEEVTAVRGAESYGTIKTLRRHKLIAKERGGKRRHYFDDPALRAQPRRARIQKAAPGSHWRRGLS